MRFHCCAHMLPNKLRRDRLAVRHLVLAVLLREALARVAVQAFVQRLHLAVEARGFLLEILRGHVVTRAPHHAEILEAELLRAFVRELDEALVLGPHRLRDRVPARPGFGELLVVAAGGDDVAELVEILAAGLPCRPCSAPGGQYLPSPYMASSSVAERRELRALRGIGRRRRAHAELEQLERARGRRDRASSLS